MNILNLGAMTGHCATAVGVNVDCGSAEINTTNMHTTKRRVSASSLFFDNGGTEQ